MVPLIILKTDTTPAIELNKLTHTFLISGESRPEKVDQFYEPVFRWFTEYFSHLNPDEKKEIINFELFINYFNSTTGKILFELIKKIKTDSQIKKIPFQVTWKYYKYDEDLLETGKELEKILKVAFVFVPVS